MKKPHRKLLATCIALTLSISVTTTLAIAQPNTEGKKAPLTTESKVLIQLAGDGKSELLMNIIGPQTNLNVVNSAGNTPLHAAAEKGHNDIVKALLKHGASYKIKKYQRPDGDAVCCRSWSYRHR